MKKNILFMMTLLLSTLWAQAARDWNPPSGNQYPSHAVVYATLFDASGRVFKIRLKSDAFFP